MGRGIDEAVNKQAAGIAVHSSCVSKWSGGVPPALTLVHFPVVRAYSGGQTSHCAGSPSLQRRGEAGCCQLAHAAMAAELGRGPRLHAPQPRPMQCATSDDKQPNIPGSSSIHSCKGTHHVLHALSLHCMGEG